MKTCSNCHYDKSTFDKRCCECVDDPKHPNWKRYTRADKIRSLDDESLAGLLANLVGDKRHWLDWLKHEAEGHDDEWRAN